ncbi:MAG: cation-translocating P-type ATPase [Patescibacteria group bacterium]
MKILRTFFKAQYLWELLRIAVVGFASLLFYFDILPLIGLLIAIAFGLYSLLKGGVLALIHEHKVGTEIFISVAVVVSVLGQEYLAGSVVLMIILIAEYIASASGESARASIKELVGSVPKTALLMRGDKEKNIAIESLKVGDIVLVRAGEKIPVDGTVVGGTASVNQAPITGESTPQEKAKGSEVFAGTILEIGALDIKMTKAGKDTVFSRIIALVEEAQSHQAPIEKFTDKVSSYLIPIVFVFVGLVYFFTRDIQLVIALLIFTSPAELGLATPLVTIAGIARGAREGILIKGGLYLEEMAHIKTVVFDKTGTLTLGQPALERVQVLDTSLTEKHIVELAAALERRSSHPLAKAVLDYAKKEKLSIPEPSDFLVIKGRGVHGKVKGEKVILGNAAFLKEQKISIPKDKATGNETLVYLANDEKVLGLLYFSDTIRPEAKASLKQLTKSGIEHIVMLTGDNEATATFVAKELGIKDFRYELLPEDKIRIIKELQKNGERVAMVGDGINDAPALVQSNVGIAMGAMGTEAAMEAADIVLMQDRLDKIAEARLLSQKSFRTIKENIFVGVGVVHITGIILVLLKVLGPVEAAAIHLVPDTLVFLNSIKLLRKKLK